MTKEIHKRTDDSNTYISNNYWSLLLFSWVSDQFVAPIFKSKIENNKRI